MGCPLACDASIGEGWFSVEVVSPALAEADVEWLAETGGPAEAGGLVTGAGGLVAGAGGLVAEAGGLVAEAA